MENILESYKKIVHKAVDLGLLSEENKLFYLSSIDQSANLDERLDQHYPQPIRVLRNSCQPSMDGWRETPRQPVVTDFCCAHAKKISVIEDTYENYSSLDLDVKNLTASESDLDYYHNYYPPGGCCIRSRVPAVCHLPQRKLKRNEINDFPIPIYVGIRKKKSKRKPKKSFRADFKSFSSEDVSHDERNTFFKRNLRSRKPESKKGKVGRRFAAVQTTPFRQNALDNNLVVCDILYDQDESKNFYSTESIESGQVCIEKAHGDGLREPEPVLSKELNPQLDIELTQSTSSKCNDTNNAHLKVSNGLPALVDNRFEASGSGSDYSKMKEVLIVHSADDDTMNQPKEKLLQVNIYCQLVPNAASNVADQKEDVPNDYCDLKLDLLQTPETSKIEKNKGSIKEKIQRKLSLSVLSKMFSKITLSSRFKK